MNKFFAVNPLIWGGSTAKFYISAQAIPVERPYYRNIFYTKMQNCLILESRPRKLLYQVRDAVRVKHYSYSTEKTYVYWIRRFIILFHDKRHPNKMGTPEVMQFLTHLAVTEHVAATTQNQAFNAIVFLSFAIKV